MFNRLFDEFDRYNDLGLEFQNFMRDEIWPKILYKIVKDNISPVDADKIINDVVDFSLVFHRTQMWMEAKKNNPDIFTEKKS